MAISDPNRKLRQARYLYEDFRESISKLRVIGYIGLFFSLLLFLSAGLLAADSYLNAVFSLALGLSILLSPQLLDLEEKSMIYFLLLAYFGVIAVEFLAVGLPDQLIPTLSEYGQTRIINIVTIFNDLTPLLYYGVRIGIGYLFFRVLMYKREVDQLPAELKGRLNIKR